MRCRLDASQLGAATVDGMTNNGTLTELIAALERAQDHLISSAADAIIDGEWDTAIVLSEAARVTNRQLRFRLDDLEELGDHEM